MCGIFYTSQIPRDGGNFINSVLSFIRHRGSISPSYVQLDEMLFAHALLPVQGRTPVLQPIISDDGLLLFAGELWSHPAYESDTLYLMNLLTRTNDIIQSVRDLDGMFAFLFYDLSDSTVYFATDTFGEIPLYYSQEDGQLLVATEMKQLIAIGVPLRYIHPVVPGSLYAFNLHSVQLSTVTYYTFSFLNDQTEYSPNTVRELIRASVEKKYSSIDLQRSALLMSGGLDSSIMAYELQRLGLTETFTVFVDPAAEDYRMAEAACLQLGLHFNPVLARELVPECAVAVTELSNRSIIDEMCCHIVLANHLADQGIHVVFTGCGADELFVGYQHLLRYRTRDTRAKLQQEFVTGYYKMDLRAFNKVYMSNAIETRHPFLCRALLEYVSHFDTDTLLIGRHREMKLALRQAYSPILGDIALAPKRIARETMGARSRLYEQYGNSPYAYRPFHEAIFKDIKHLEQLLHRAQGLR